MNLELLEDELQAVTQAEAYKSKEEAIEHALEVLLAENPLLRADTAIELYCHGKVTLSRAVEVSGLEWDTFKGRLSERGIAMTVDESPDEVQTGVILIRHLRDAS
jgi:predicted HTH domain antitoxin